MFIQCLNQILSVWPSSTSFTIKSRSPWFQTMWLFIIHSPFSFLWRTFSNNRRCVFRALPLSASKWQFSHFFLSWALFMCRLRKTLFFVTKSHSLNLNSVWCLFSTCPLISLPSLPVKSHREHFTLGLIEASGPFRPRVFFGLWFVWRGGGMMPLTTSIRSTWFWST